MRHTSRKFSVLMLKRGALSSVLISAALLFSSQLAFAQFAQQGSKLVGTGAVGSAGQGSSVALSADGNTAIVGGSGDNSGIGAAWVYTRSGAVWTQQGDKLVGSGAVGSANQGISVALSADGNTAIVGGSGDNSGIGAAWVYTRSGAVWTQQGSKLVGNGAVGSAGQGSSVALSADGNTAIVGGPSDNFDPNFGGIGAAWVYTRSGGIWTQQGDKLVGSGAVRSANQGYSVALSADGNTAIVGGPQDNGDIDTGGSGAAWVFTRSGVVWTQQGSKLVSSGEASPPGLGYSVALSGDGNTAIVGGPLNDGANGGIEGAAWVYTRNSAVWTQQGSKLVGSGAVAYSDQGNSVALSSDGNTAITGGFADDSEGAAWVFTRNGGVWTQQGSKLVGTGAVGNAVQGNSVALSGDGNTAIVGGPGDNSFTGAAWVFVQSLSLQLTPRTDIVTSGNPGGPFTPSSFQYQLSATASSINYSISGYPNWLTPSSTSGNVSSSGTTVTFTVNANANSLAPGTYGPTSIIFTNTDTGQGTQTRTATLTVNPPRLNVTPSTGIAASGHQGGPFTPSSFSYSLSAVMGSLKYSITNVPSWLTASPKSGTATTRATSVTFRINPTAADKLAVGINISNINFNDTTNNQVTTRAATLTVTPKNYTVMVSASPAADGTVTGGGTFAGGTSDTVTATPKSGHIFLHWTENGRVVSTSESYTFTVSANATLIADFR
jgi:Divergent InlB B-repeat domain/FG-GAP repeat